MKGTAIFSVTIYGKYDGRNKRHYTYCQKHQFAPGGGGFLDLGECEFAKEQADIEKNGCK